MVVKKIRRDRIVEHSILRPISLPFGRSGWSVMTETASATTTTGTSHEQLMLYCFNEAPDIGLEDISVFVIKVHAYLRLRKLPYTNVKWAEVFTMSRTSVGPKPQRIYDSPGTSLYMKDWASIPVSYRSGVIVPKPIYWSEHNMKGLPRGKLPTLKVGERLVPDSTNIISELEAMRPESERLDANLSAEQRAVARAMREMVEESFYWTGMVYTRWVRDDGWAATREKYFTHVPGIFKPFLGFFRGSIVKTYTGQGHGRRPEEEVISIANAQLDALSDFLGNKPYFMGDDITTLDMTMYGFLSAVKRDVGWYPNCPTRKHMQTKANLLEYVDRVAARVQPQS